MERECEKNWVDWRGKIKNRGEASLKNRKMENNKMER